MDRIDSLEDFWPYYLSEHRDPRSRALHFVGTSLFFASIVGAVVSNPLVFPIALLVMVGLGAWGVRMESTRAAYLPAALLVLVGTATAPMFVPAGIICAYACAWFGHFRIEHNRPATFTYPVWSFLCDFRMWGHMARGRLWTGDPLEALGLSYAPDA